MESSSEVANRIAKLEEFKHDLEKKLYAATAIASIFGLLGIVGSFWITHVTDKLSALSDRTKIIETKLEGWDKEVTDSLATLEKTKISSSQELEDYATSIIDDTKTQLEQSVSEIGTEKLIEKLQDGSVSLSLSGLSILNDSGDTVVDINSDKNNNGYIQVNAKNGYKRYVLSLSKNTTTPTINFYNDDNIIRLSLGIFSNTNDPFLRFWDIDGIKPVREIKSD